MMTFTRPPRNCPRCKQGVLYPDYDGDLSCIACGEMLYCTPAYEPLLQLPPARLGRPPLPPTPAQEHRRDYNRKYQRERRAKRQRSA